MHNAKNTQKYEKWSEADRPCNELGDFPEGL